MREAWLPDVTILSRPNTQNDVTLLSWVQSWFFTSRVLSIEICTKYSRLIVSSSMGFEIDYLGLNMLFG